MNKWEKQVQSSLLKDELRILKTLKLMYSDVMRETVERMELFFLRVSADPTDAAAVYQFRYQQALAEQLSAILDGFDERNYTTIEDYLKECYTTGYVGAMYDIHHQGIPVIEPIRQENVVRAITLNSKISVPMYTRLGTDIAQLKTAIAAEVTRGIASGHSWHDTAAGIARQGNVSAYNAMRIARTEGHRIACEAQMDGCKAAKEAGADVVKEWNAALDDRTREHHKLLNGQLRELDDAFEVDGIRVQYPGDFGRPEEDIHCRCALLQRARWALSEEELEKLQSTPEAKELAEIDDFGKFKDKYIEVTAQQVEDSEDVSAEKSTGNPPETVDFSAESGIMESEGQAAIRQAFTFNESTRAEDVARAIIENHEALAEFTPASMKAMLEELGFTPKPLGKSKIWKGIPFEEGGGYRIDYLGNGYFQYHPASGSHHEKKAYWRVSCSEIGDVRYDMFGEQILE